MGDSYGRAAAMDFDFVPASPDSRWAGETAARRRQRRLSSPSLRTYLTPAFDAVAAGEGGVSGYSSSSSSSGGLDLGFDASLLRYRRGGFHPAAELDSRVLLYSPQSAPLPPPQQARMAYPVADDGIWAAGGYHYGSKHEAGRLSATPGFQHFEDGTSFISTRQTSADHPSAAPGASIKPPAALRSPEGAVLATKAELSTPGPPTMELYEELGLTKEEDDLITKVLYGDSGKRRLSVFRDICPE